MRRGLLALFVLLTSCGPEFSGEAWTSQRSALTSVTGFGSNPGGLTLFIHEPASLGTNVPLVVAMHGCSQTADGYVPAGWNTLADQHRFLVAYPQTTGNAGCFDWFSGSQQTRSGAQVTSILQMVQHLVTTRGVDPSRVYVTGLSAGGAMTGVLLAVAPDVFSRGAIMSALPFACATSQLQGLNCMNAPPDQTPAQWGALVRAVSGSNAAPRVSIWHGTSDSTVRVGNLQEQVDQWTDVNAIDVTADVTTTIGIATRREFKNAAGLTLVESWSLAGMGHGTAIDVASGCGTASAFILDVEVCSSRFAAEFFGLTSTSDAGVPSTDAGVVVPDAGSPDAGSSACLGEWFATNVSHFNSGRAVLCSGRYCAVGSGDLLGDSLDMTWVRQTGTTRFEAGRCSVQPDAGVGGGSGGGSATGGGSGTTGGGSGTTGGGGSATGGSGSATGGGGNATGGGGGAANPSGCGCVSVEPIALSLIALYLVRRRRQTT
ncbi:MAG: PHB depolymerase family esterase [Archangium sp.]|nr:PHB depolymerase family esterase [Archangium sp.]